jgi:hypothetical protein
MKLLPVFTVLTLALSSLHAAAPSAEVQQILTEGQTAFNKGDYATAKGAFEMVYQMDPRNVLAISYLTKIKALEKGVPKAVDQEKQLAGLIIPKVQLKEATIGAVFDYLKMTAGKISDGKASVNFVLKLPDDVIKTQTITLNMTDAPFTEVVKYVAELANLNVQYQKYAVLVTPKGGAAPEAPAPVAPLQ